jgi:hemerythrin-like metal-binding protein
MQFIHPPQHSGARSRRLPDPDPGEAIPFIPWTNSLRVGIASVDKEHRQLCDAINDLHNAIGKKELKPHVGSLLNRVLEVASEHFASEEKLMAGDKYPGVALHSIKHQHLLQQIDALVTRCKRDSASLNEHALVFLRDWFKTHIVTDDRNFGLWLNEHGKN